MLKVVASRERVLRARLDAAGMKKSRRECLALSDVPLDRKFNNPHRFIGLARAPWIDTQTRANVEWGFFCKACSPCLTKDIITLPTDEDPRLRCEGCKKCDYSHLGGTGDCDACLNSDSNKCKHSGGKPMFRTEDYAPHFDECERSKEVVVNCECF